MAEFRRCMLFLVNAAAALLSVSGAGITLKYVCPGDSVQAFQNIEFDRCNAIVSLHINGKRNTEIATWVWRDCSLNATCLDAYKDRVFLDPNGTITIHNLHHFDQGKYVVISKKDALPSIKEVQIIVMVEPSKDCKPMIMRLGNKLFASLKHDVCGTPVATLYWKDYEGVSDTNDSILKITPGIESRTYYACIQGPALQCAKNRMPLDNCSPFIIEGNTSQTKSSESSNTNVYIVTVIVLGTLLILGIVAIVIVILRYRRKRYLNGKHTAGLLDTTCPNDKHFDDENAEHAESLKLCEDDCGNRRSPSNDQQERLETRSDDVNAEHAESLKLCDEDCENRRSPSNDQQERLETRNDMDFEMNEVGTDHQSGIDPETIRELQELRDAALCKICFANKTSVFFMPCNHVATCDKCSISLDNCPVCRATIKERKTISFESNE